VAKRSKTTRKSSTRRLKEERLIIADPESSLDKLLKKPEPSTPTTPSHDGSLDQLLTKKPVK
jgi:hypothetical protein